MTCMATSMSGKNLFCGTNTGRYMTTYCKAGNNTCYWSSYAQKACALTLCRVRVLIDVGSTVLSWDFQQNVSHMQVA